MGKGSVKLGSLKMKREELQARRYFVSGRVQGVGYRIFAQRAAVELGLTGYTRNRADGRVEVFAMGPEPKLRKLRIELRNGPLMARVTEVSEEPAVVDPRYSESFAVETTI
jgi:acylphosphatase